MHQARFGVDADVRFHPEEIYISFLRLMHFRGAFTVLVLGRTQRMNDRCVNHRALAQHQTTITQIAIDDLQNPVRQIVFFHQTPEVDYRGFVRNSIQMQHGKLAQDRGLVQCLFHRRIAVAEPVLHQVNPQRSHQWI